MRNQDYVIKNGKFIGQFEQMYRESSEIPWHQDETSHAVFSNMDSDMDSDIRYCDTVTYALTSSIQNGCRHWMRPRIFHQPSC